MKEAFKWLLRAAVGGNSESQARASEFYRLGVSGVINKNAENAYYFARVSAQQFSTEGRFAAAICLIYGIGIEKRKSIEIHFQMDTSLLQSPL